MVPLCASQAPSSHLSKPFQRLIDSAFPQVNKALIVPQPHKQRALATPNEGVIILNPNVTIRFQSKCRLLGGK